MNENKELLGTAPIGKLLFKLAVPTVVAQLINMLYNIVDRIYIGHMPEVGSFALTGVGVCMPIIMIITAFAALISSGGAPRASIYMGKGEHETSEKILGNCFVLQLIISAVLTLILLISNKGLLLTFGASKNTIDYATGYMNIYAIGTVFVQITLGMGAFITAQGFAKIGMMTVLIGAVSNIILDPVFIYLFNMGVSGAALATIISQALSCVWVLKFLRGKKSILKLKKINMKIEPEIILPCIALGLSAFVMQGSESVISVCFNSSLLKYGGDIAVGAMTILTGVMQFAMLPMQGVAQGAQPISSYNFGAKNADRVKKTFKWLITICLIYSFAIWCSVMLFPKAFVSVFTSETELIIFASKVLRIYCGVLCIFGAQIACQMTFVSTGNAPCSIIVAVVRKFVLLIPLIYIVPQFVQNKAMGVYMAEPIADVIAVLFTVILFAIQFRKSMKSLEKNA